jgi:hypothetical protein
MFFAADNKQQLFTDTFHTALSAPAPASSAVGSGQAYESLKHVLRAVFESALNPPTPPLRAMHTPGIAPFSSAANGAADSGFTPARSFSMQTQLSHGDADPLPSAASASSISIPPLRSDSRRFPPPATPSPHDQSASFAFQPFVVNTSPIAPQPSPAPATSKTNLDDAAASMAFSAAAQDDKEMEDL